MIRIVLTGGGTGGHIYPLVAVADEIKKIASPEAGLFFIGPRSPLNEEFKKRDIRVFTILGSKLRRYFDFENILDIPKFFISLIQALIRLYSLMPDVVFSKSGPGALAVVIAARFYFIPVIIHESDAVAGLTNRFSSYLAQRIGIAFSSAASYFPSKKLALVGIPLRQELIEGAVSSIQAKENLQLEPKEPLLVVLGGSQGTAIINAFVFDNLESLLGIAQVFHQVGAANFEDAERLANSILKDYSESLRNRYRLVAYLSASQLKNILSAADVILSRAGASAIFEIAAFGKPAILIPLEGAANDHQRANAYEYARGGAAIVIEEANFKPHIVLLQLKNILSDGRVVQTMATAAKEFAKPGAAEIIAREILLLGKYRPSGKGGTAKDEIHR